MTQSPAPFDEDITAWGRAEGAALTILVPYHRHDPCLLLRGLAQAPQQAKARTALILVDDGSNDDALDAAVAQAAPASDLAGLRIRWRRNRGRAQARNRLIAAARTRHVLFLDADMRPLSADFLPAWLALIDAADPAVAFGGFSVAEAKDSPVTALHKFMSARSDCRSAAARRADPAQFTATSNLLVRADVLAATPFDEAFTGWGWEDVDWALRAQAHGAIIHIDNPAVHLGLDSVDTLLRKFAEAGPNYARIAAKHPEAVRHFASWRMVQALKRVPGHPHARPLLAALARDRLGLTPMLARHFALKLYRTSHYAEHAK